MLKSIIKTAACTVAGAITGAAYGTAMIPVYWACDATAPVSYPLSATASAVCFYKGYRPTAHIPKPIVLGAGLFGACMVPFTPINAISRPVVTPITFGVVGAAAGFAVASL